MINELKVIQLKFQNNVLTYLPILLTTFLILFLHWYLGKDWHTQQIANYTSIFNAVSPLLLSINVYQAIHFEEKIGHFNHILSKSHRHYWISANAIYIYSIYTVCLLLSSIYVFIMSQSLTITFIYFSSSFIFNILALICTLFLGVFVNSIFTIVLGIFLVIFNVYFGIEVLGDYSWFYIPLTYATRFVAMFLNDTLPLITIITLNIFSLSIITSILFYSFSRWSGRSVKD